MRLTLSEQTPPPLQSLPSARAEGLYVHIPFCFHKCHYCDFYSITRQSEDRMARFVDLMLAEADQWAAARRGPDVSPLTVFFGGGTPTLLPINEMSRLLRGLHDRFDLSDVSEWTVECNPATASLEYCAMLREHGVNRISLGAQSFSRDELKTLERHHDPDDVPAAIALARCAGFQRLNIDLIYAIPGQDLASWQRALETALALDLEHLSCYGLTYESNTPMAVKKRLGQITPADDNLELQMLRCTRHRLSSTGYRAYEISNYARPGAECKHNLMYWTGGNYIGLGPAAASHINGTRWRNRPHLGEWENAALQNTFATTDFELLTPRQRAGEIIMLQLRLASGVLFDSILEKTGLDPRTEFTEAIDRLASLNLITTHSQGFRLSESGLAVADAVSGEFL